MRYSLTMLILLSVNLGFSQNVGIGTTNPHPSAQLDVSSNNKGLLPPRMTFDERNAILNPAQGLMIYCTDCGINDGEPQYYSGKNWLQFNGLISNPPSVKIGNQIWMKKNLNTSKYRNGDPISQITDQSQWASLTAGAWCWYNNDSATYSAVYGKLYNWYALSDPRGVCPAGWHIPNDMEWSLLIDSLGGAAVAGGALKSVSGWENPNLGASNSSGFSALPGGLRGNTGYFNVGGSQCYFWSSSLQDIDRPYFRNLNSNYASVYKGYGYSKDGFSVRCVKD